MSFNSCDLNSRSHVVLLFSRQSANAWIKAKDIQTTRRSLDDSFMKFEYDIKEDWAIVGSSCERSTLTLPRPLLIPSPLLLELFGWLRCLCNEDSVVSTLWYRCPGVANRITDWIPLMAVEAIADAVLDSICVWESSGGVNGTEVDECLECIVTSDRSDTFVFVFVFVIVSDLPRYAEMLLITLGA